MILRMIWRNLWRNSRRTWITTASITFSVFLAIGMQSFQKGAFDNLIKNMVGYYTGYIQVHQQGYWKEQVLDHCFEEHDSIFNHLKSVPGVIGTASRLETFVLASMGTITKGCLLVGADIEAENEIFHLEEKLISGSYLARDEEAVLLAEGLAKRLRVRAGDTLVLFGQGLHGSMAAGKYPIKGILHFAAPEMNNNMLYLPLEPARYLLNAENRLTSIALQIDHPDRMNSIRDIAAARLGDTYETMTWEELLPEISSHIKADNASSFMFSGILYLIIGFGFFGTIMMMTAERQYEFGMLIAIGMKKIHLSLILLGETFLITLLGIGFGFMISIPVVLYFMSYPIRFTGEWGRAWEQFGFEPIMPTAFDPAIFVSQSLIVFCLALLIGLYPFWHIRRIDPVAAMK